MKFAAVIIRARSIQTGNGPDEPGMLNYIKEQIRYQKVNDSIHSAYIFVAGVSRPIREYTTAAGWREGPIK